MKKFKAEYKITGTVEIDTSDPEYDDLDTSEEVETLVRDDIISFLMNDIATKSIDVDVTITEVVSV